MSSLNNSGNHKFLTKSTLYYFKIIGLLPLTLKLSDKNIRLHASRSGYIYNIILIATIFGLDFLSIPYIYELSNGGESLLSARLKLTKAIIGTIVLFILWFFMCIRKKTLADIVNRFVDVDEELINLSHVHRIENSNLLLIGFFLINMMIWIGVIASDIILLNHFGASMVYWVSMMIPSYIVSWLLIQYTMVLCLLTDRFRNVNRTIIKLCPAYEIIEENCLEVPATRIPLDRSVVGTILAVKRIHASYYDVANDVANFYAIPILFAVTFYCGTIIYSAYYLVIPLITMEVDEQIVVIDGVFMLAMQFFPIVIMAICVNRLTHEMNLTADAVHKLLTWSIPSREVRSELKKFSLELLHKNVEFSAHGVFPLDCTLVHSIFSIAVTYLIILVQFQTSPQTQKM